MEAFLFTEMGRLSGATSEAKVITLQPLQKSTGLFSLYIWRELLEIFFNFLKTAAASPAYLSCLIVKLDPAYLSYADCLFYVNPLNYANLPS